MERIEKMRARIAELRSSLTDVRDELETLDPDADNYTEASDDLFARADEILTEIEQTEERAAKLERIAAATDVTPATRTAPIPTRDTNPYDLSEIRTTMTGPDPREMRTRALRAIETETDLTAESQAHAAKLVRRSPAVAAHVLVTGNPDYRTGWAKTITGNGHLLTSDEQKAMAAARALSLTTTAGGFAVPFTLDPTVILTSDGVVNPMRQIARTTTIVTDQWNGVSSAGVTASWDGEAGAVGDDAPTLAQPSIDVEKAQAFVPASIEITQDWAGIAEELGLLFADAKDTLEGAAFVTGAGSGSNQPTGVVTAVAAVTASRVSATTNNAYGLVDVYALLEGLPPRHRPRASWMANLAIINDTRQFATANNYHGFLTDLAGDTPRQLLGKPLYEASAMDGVIATGNDDVLLIGDFSKYLIVDRVGLAVEFIPHLFDTTNNRPTGQRGWYAYWRTGGGALDANAFRILRV